MSSLSLPWLVIIVGIVVIVWQSFIHWHQSIKTKEITLATPGMPSVVTLMVLTSALFIILSGHYTDAEQKWAFGVVGTILGYWLKQ